MGILVPLKIIVQMKQFSCLMQNIPQTQCSIYDMMHNYDVLIFAKTPQLTCGDFPKCTRACDSERPRLVRQLNRHVAAYFKVGYRSD